MRTKTFNVRLSEQEWGWLQEIADHYAIGVSNVIRMLAKREHERIIEQTGGQRKQTKRRGERDG